MSLTIPPARIVEESTSPLLSAPASWRRKPLGEVATVLNGFAFKSQQFVPEGGVPLIRIRDIFKKETAVGYVGEYDEKYLVGPGELLVGMDGDFNCARWAGSEALLNQRVCKITPDDKQLDLDYLTVILPGYLQAIHDYTSSTTVTHLSSKDVALIPIPLPSLGEQKALASAVGSAENSASAAAARLRNVRVTVTRFRQAVLAAGCSGRLTADWRSGRGIVDGDLPGNWQREQLGELAESIRGGSTEVPSTELTAYPVLRSSSVRPFSVDYSDVRYLTEVQSTREQNYLKDGDLLITRLSGSIEYVGNCAVVQTLGERRIQYPDRLFCCRFVDPRDADFVEMAFAGREIRAQIEAASRSAAGHQRISISDLKGFCLLLPPRDEQVEIVRRTSQLLESAEALVVRVDVASKHVERSAQAVLAKAFRGELVS